MNAARPDPLERSEGDEKQDLLGPFEAKPLRDPKINPFTIPHGDPDSET